MTKDSLKMPIPQWVHWFNHIRLLELIGNIQPTKTEENQYLQLANSFNIIALT